MHNLDDYTLAKLCIVCDDRAIGELKRRYGPLIHWTVRNGLPTALTPDFDIIVDEIWDRIFGALPDWRGQVTLKPFLATIAARRTIDHFRKHKERRAVVDFDAIGISSDPLEQLVAKEQMDCIRRTAERYGFAEHLELWLDGASTEEIARELKIGERMVQLQWTRMKDCFLRALKRAEHPRL